MRISKKAEYALRSLCILASRSPGSPMQIHELAEAGDIPVKFLEQILLVLKRADLLRSKRGIGGGYQLNQVPARITVGEVIRIVDGDVNHVEGPPVNLRSPGVQGLRQCLRELDGMIHSYLEEQTIESVLLREDPEGGLGFEI